MLTRKTNRASTRFGASAAALILGVALSLAPWATPKAEALSGSYRLCTAWVGTDMAGYGKCVGDRGSYQIVVDCYFDWWWGRTTGSYAGDWVQVGQVATRRCPAPGYAHFAWLRYS